MDSTKHLSRLTGLEIRALSSEQINAWTPSQIQQLTPIQLQTLTSTQLKEMRPELIQAFSALQRSVFSALQLRALMGAAGIWEADPQDTLEEDTKVAAQVAVATPKVKKTVAKKPKALEKALELEPSEITRKQETSAKEVAVADAMFPIIADGI